MFLLTPARCPAHWIITNADYVEGRTPRARRSLKGCTAMEAKTKSKGELG